MNSFSRVFYSVLLLTSLLYGVKAKPCVPALEWSMGCGFQDGVFKCRHLPKASQEELPFVLRFDGRKSPERAILLKRAEGSLKQAWSAKVPWSSVGLVSGDGRRVLLLSAYQRDESKPNLWLLDERGKVVATLNLFQVLSEEERMHLSRSSCGTQWYEKGYFKDGAFHLQVVQEDFGPASQAQLPLVVKLDIKTHKLIRGPEREFQDVKSLISGFQQNQDPNQRDMFLIPLWTKSQLSAMRGNADLRAFWITRIKDAQEEERIVRLAVRCLAVVGNRQDLLDLQALTPGRPELNLGVLDALKLRLPERMRAYARTALGKKYQPQLLRSRALNALIKRGGGDAVWAVEKALVDPAPRVRESAVGYTGQVAPDAKGFGWLLDRLVDSDGQVVRRARTELLSFLEKRGSSHSLFWRTLQARVKPEQDSWGGWLVLLAGQAERKGDKKQAEALYRKGLASLEDGDRALRAEAVLRLAGFALERKDVKGAQRHIALLQKHGLEGEFVCAPAVSRWVDPSCPGTYTASRVARDMLAGKGVTPGQPTVDPKQKKAFIAATIEATCYVANHSQDKDLRQRSVDILAKHGFDEKSFQELGQQLQRDPKVQNEIALGRIRCHPKREK